MSRNSLPGLRLGAGLDRIVLAEPLFNLLSLRGQHDTLPLHHTGTLAVLSHHVRTLIADLDEAVKIRPSEVVRREDCVVLLHLHLE